jgi:hypothetical protein
MQVPANPGIDETPITIPDDEAPEDFTKHTADELEAEYWEGAVDEGK